MTETLKFDTEVAAQAVALRAKSREAADAVEEARAEKWKNINTYHRLGEIAAESRFGRWKARKERAELEASLPPIARADPNNEALNKQSVQRFDEGAVKYTQRMLTNADNAAKQHYEANGVATVDNAIVEANLDFGNRGSEVRIIATPEAMQEQLDKAVSLSAMHQAAKQPTAVR